MSIYNNDKWRKIHIFRERASEKKKKNRCLSSSNAFSYDVKLRNTSLVVFVETTRRAAHRLLHYVVHQSLQQKGQVLSHTQKKSAKLITSMQLQFNLQSIRQLHGAERCVTAIHDNNHMCVQFWVEKKHTNWFSMWFFCMFACAVPYIMRLLWELLLIRWFCCTLEASNTAHTNISDINTVVCHYCSNHIVREPCCIYCVCFFSSFSMSFGIICW